MKKSQTHTHTNKGIHAPAKKKYDEIQISDKSNKDEIKTFMLAGCGSCAVASFVSKYFAEKILRLFVY